MKNYRVGVLTLEQTLIVSILILFLSQLEKKSDPRSAFTLEGISSMFAVGVLESCLGKERQRGVLILC